jgi:hypothetical protein
MNSEIGRQDDANYRARAKDEPEIARKILRALKDSLPTIRYDIILQTDWTYEHPYDIEWFIEDHFLAYLEVTKQENLYQAKRPNGMIISAYKIEAYPRLRKLEPAFILHWLPNNPGVSARFLDLLLRITMPKPTAAIIPRVAKIKRNS